MVSENTAQLHTAFTVTIDASDVTTGISAYERAHTIQKFVQPETKAEDFVRPGHIFPLQAKDGGVLRRAGHTEATVDLARLAGLYPAGVLCEILNEDGTMARLPQLFEFAQKVRAKVHHYCGPDRLPTANGDTHQAGCRGGSPDEARLLQTPFLSKC